MKRLWRLWRDRARLRNTPLFDADWYLSSYPDLTGLRRLGRSWTVDPAWHYLTHGAAEGRDPGPLFSSSGYRLQAETGRQNPLLHHLDRLQANTALPQAGLPSLPGMLTHQQGPVLLVFAHQALGQQFGAERSLLHLLDRALRAGMVPEVVLPQCLDPGYLAALRARARRVHVLPCPWRRAGRVPHPATLARIEGLIRDSGAIELHQNTLVLDAPLLAARRAGVPAVVHLRERPDQDDELCARLGQGAEPLRSALLEQADRFIANSEATARWIDPEGAMPSDRLVVLPNSADPDLAALPFAPQNPLRVGLIGSNTAKKGIGDLRAVAQLAAARGLALRFVLIGPATADLAALGPLPDNLQHAGYADGPVAALAQVDVVLSLSHFAESYGRTVLEALTAGRPVICYDRGTPPALLGDSGAGRVVAADDPVAVVAALAELTASPDLLAAASAAARTRAADLAAAAGAVPDALIFGVPRIAQQT